MSAVANVRALFSGRDRDTYDRICDHLLVLDHSRGRRAGDRRHLSPAPPGGCRRSGRDSTRPASSTRAAARAPPRPGVPRTRPLLRAQALPHQAHGGAPLARHLELRAPAQYRRDDRLRLARGQRIRAGSRRSSAAPPGGADARGMAGEGAARPRRRDRQASPIPASTRWRRSASCRR